MYINNQLANSMTYTTNSGGICRTRTNAATNFGEICRTRINATNSGGICSNNCRRWGHFMQLALS